jgi:hypothetical protein
MNERIRELMIESGMQFKLDNIPTHIDSNGSHTFNEFYACDKFDPEKFAELLIRECLGIIVESGSGSHLKPAPYYHIKQHFGVEG